MSLSALTVFILVLSIPGILFFLGIRRGGLVKASDLFDTNIQEFGMMLAVSLLILLSILIFSSFIIPDYLNNWLQVLHDSKSEEYITGVFISAILVPFLLFMVFSSVLGYLAGTFYPRFYFGKREESNNSFSSNLKEFFYHTKKDELIWVWVVTNTSHNNKNLMYLGLVRSIKIEDDAVQSIVLEFPSKTYIDFSKRLQIEHKATKSKASLPKKMGLVTKGESENILYLSKENITNVFFQRCPTV